MGKELVGRVGNVEVTFDPANGSIAVVEQGQCIYFDRVEEAAYFVTLVEEAITKAKAR